MIDEMSLRTVIARGGAANTLEGAGFSVRTVRLPGRPGRTIAFLPSLGEAWSAWLQPMLRLVEIGSCLGLDPPLTAPGEAPATLETRVGALLTVLDREGGLPVWLVGASIGGIVSMRAARVRPDRVRGVVAVALRPDLPDLSGIRELLAVRGPEDVPALLARTWAQPPPTPRSALERLAATLAGEEVRRGVLEVAACDLVRETRETLAAGVPLAFLYGALDRLLAGPEGPFPPGVVVRRLEGCGHHPQYEKRDETAAFVAETIRRVEGDRA